MAAPLKSTKAAGAASSVGVSMVRGEDSTPPPAFERSAPPIREAIQQPFDGYQKCHEIQGEIKLFLPGLPLWPDAVRQGFGRKRPPGGILRRSASLFRMPE
jgi:hypothetical protein